MWKLVFFLIFNNFIFKTGKISIFVYRLSYRIYKNQIDFHNWFTGIDTILDKTWPMAWSFFIMLVCLYSLFWSRSPLMMAKGRNATGQTGRIDRIKSMNDRTGSLPRGVRRLGSPDYFVLAIFAVFIPKSVRRGFHFSPS